jgi:hypothetical protein
MLTTFKWFENLHCILVLNIIIYLTQGYIHGMMYMIWRKFGITYCIKIQHVRFQSFQIILKITYKWFGLQKYIKLWKSWIQN